MTTDPQLEDQVKCMQQSLCGNPALREQLKALAILGRGGKIVLIYNKQNGLQFVAFENQLPAVGG